MQTNAFWLCSRVADYLTDSFRTCIMSAGDNRTGLCLIFYKNTMLSDCSVCCLSPWASSAAPCRSLRGRLESLGESDRQMCHQVNLSDSSRNHSWACCPSLPVCALVLQPPVIVSSHSCSPSSLFPFCVLFLRLSPTPFFSEVPALVFSHFWCLHPVSCFSFLSLMPFIIFVLMWLPLFLSFKELWMGSFPAWSYPWLNPHRQKVKWKDARWGCSTQASYRVIKYSI